jgi:alpha-2-macroglobulin
MPSTSATLPATATASRPTTCTPAVVQPCNSTHWRGCGRPAAHAAIGKVFQNRAVETAGAANFATTYGDDANLILQSDRRTDGVILEALIAEQPDSDLIPKVVSGLLGNKVAGRWDNIQENSFILLALKKYFDTYEKQTPDFVARVWLGDRFAGDHTFAGRTTDRVRVAIPTADLIAVGDTDLTIAKEGIGRLYYRIGLRYAPASLRLDPLDRGFVVGRSYEGVDNPADVTRDPDGTWRIKAGATVRVRLTVVAESQRTRVALIDPLPAGLEIVNPSLATTPDLPPDTQPAGSQSADSSRFRYGTWFDHQNMRDDRAEAFSTLLPGGTYDYSYVARATTPGTFVAPPTRAEEIYAPETFGRGVTDSVVIG